MKEIIILGSTGSIGRQTLEVVRRYPEKYRVTSLCANTSVNEVEAQAREFKPQTVALFDQKSAKELKERLKDTDIRVLAGKEGVCAAASGKGDIAVCAIVGIAGLRPTIEAIKAKKTIALANKETMVTAGDIVNDLARENNVKILPVDSEHSAIFQSLQGVPAGNLHKIILTCSGGPFFGKTAEQLKDVSVADTLAHPNWSMGRKITVDSATLMNKGLEVIEAVHLFGVKPSDIQVVVHRQSILHSAVELNDGAVIAEMGTPDMRLPIQYALSFPNREPAFERLDLITAGKLEFAAPDTKTFRCLPLCIEAIERGGLYPAAINGANEESVALFLDNKIKFNDIATLNEMAMNNCENKQKFELSDIFDADANARKFVRETVKG